jgi:hypothetical protein
MSHPKDSNWNVHEKLSLNLWRWGNCIVSKCQKLTAQWHSIILSRTSERLKVSCERKFENLHFFLFSFLYLTRAAKGDRWGEVVAYGVANWRGVFLVERGLRSSWAETHKKSGGVWTTEGRARGDSSRVEGTGVRQKRLEMNHVFRPWFFEGWSGSVAEM